MQFHVKAHLWKDVFPNSCRFWKNLLPWELLKGGPPFLAGHGLEVTHSHCHFGLSNIAACFIKTCKPRRKDSESKTKVTVLCRLITEMTSHLLFRLTLIIRMSLDSSDSRGRNYPTLWILGCWNCWRHHRVCLPQQLYTCYFNHLV